uniref:GDP-fucose protein O-fucosyltransferase 2 n=1 Tax=Panagrellus redivivus TaxID=6233 RepID=A0A7E4VQW6_PANRE
MRLWLYVSLLLLVNPIYGYDEDEADEVTISKKPENVSPAKPQRYLLYEVNFGEGFNLRRDVYMRMASLVHELREQGHNFVLVLPPWGNLYHWNDRAKKVPWNNLFDTEAMNAYVPVIEFYEYLKVNPYYVDEVVYLQHYKEGWKDGKWSERYEKRDCIEADKYYRKEGKFWKGYMYSYDHVKIHNLTCLSIQGESSTLAKAINEYYPNTNTLFIDRAETVIHNEYGGVEYWKIRRSMRYHKQLRFIADLFRQETLYVNMHEDKIVYPKDWRDERELQRVAVGGDYLAVHLRRKDFLRSHSDHVPDLNEAALQIIEVAQVLELSKVFICSDADEYELLDLEKQLNSSSITAYRFTTKKISDGAISLVDQWIAAKAAFFLGTHTSTFSYRIREDREIMHFPVETTFNSLCKYAKDMGNPKKCEQPAKWTIVY